jgi:hypothetical protein
MPFTMPNYPTISWEGANPFATGVKQGIGTAKDYMDFLSKELENQKNRKLMPFVEPMAQEAFKKEQQYNQMYKPNIESQIGLRGAQQGYYGAQANETNTMLAEKLKELQQKNEMYKPLTEAQIKNQEALAKWHNLTGGGTGRGAGQQELVALNQQLSQEHPEWDETRIMQARNAYLEGKRELPDGTKLPEPSGSIATTLGQVWARTSTADMRNNAAALANTVDELNHIDLEPIKEFAGLGGKAKYLAQKTGAKPRTEMWRKYDAFKNVGAILVMDSLRQALKTTVVPDYVNNTIGKFANPNDEMWDDPEQVQKKWDLLLGWINRSARNAGQQARQGANANLSANNNISNNESSSTEKESKSNGNSKKEIPKIVRDENGKLVRAK